MGAPDASFADFPIDVERHGRVPAAHAAALRDVDPLGADAETSISAMTE
jgi:hypothetical protein